MNHLQMIACFTDCAISPRPFTPLEFLQRAENPNKEYIIRCKQVDQFTQPRGKFDHVVNDQIMLGAHDGWSATVERLEEARPHHAPVEIAAVVPACRQHVCLNKLVR